jgi:hypothetical protein
LVRIDYCGAADLEVVPRRHVAGGMPTIFLNARLNAASDS